MIWAEIDHSALRRNLARIRALAGERRTIAVVKADAYGHGVLPVSRTLLDAGCECLAVASVDEARPLREAGLACPLLLLQGIRSAEEAEPVLALRAVPLVCAPEAIEPLERAAASHSRRAPVHLKLDTGMGRLGVLPVELGAVIELLRRSTHLALEGVATHLACADDPASPDPARQRKLFAELLGAVRAAGFRPEWIHVDSSAGVAHGPTPDTSAVRPGIALYGVDPTLERGLPLDPVMTLVARVSRAKSLPAGARVGYGGDFVTARETRILTLPLGYADGLPRSASGRFALGVRGERRPLVGRVSMDLATLDAGPTSSARVGDEVLVFGRRQGLTIRVEELAEAAGTLAYEILVGIGPRVSRVHT
jgi:alanine racemase